VLVIVCGGATLTAEQLRQNLAQLQAKA